MRLLLLATTTGYQTRAFVEAAGKLGLEVVFGSDRCHVLDDPWQDGALPLRFENPEESSRQIVEFARSAPVAAIVSLGDRPTPTAAWACRALGLPHHPPDAADACRDKFQARARLRDAGLNTPAFARFPLEARPSEILARARIEFPCVLKPLALSASRGVIRADDSGQFSSAFERIRDMLRAPEVQVMREETSNFIQVENYVEGEEVAVEGLVDRGRLRVLAIFDKPDPLEGPYFEETIYVTPSRLKAETQTAITETLERATRAMGLFHGPLHAEVRINSRGVWILEVAARSIGGLCSRALRFIAPDISGTMSLEELIIRLALRQEVGRTRREAAAAGVMMIPVPEGGVFQEVKGVKQALDTPHVEEVHITAKANQKLVPWPEGSSYLGFIFACAPSPEAVEQALRCAHKKLHFHISPALPVV